VLKLNSIVISHRNIIDLNIHNNKLNRSNEKDQQLYFVNTCDNCKYSINCFLCKKPFIISDLNRYLQIINNYAIDSRNISEKEYPVIIRM